MRFMFLYKFLQPHDKEDNQIYNEGEESVKIAVG